MFKVLHFVLVLRTWRFPTMIPFQRHYTRPHPHPTYLSPLPPLLQLNMLGYDISFAAFKIVEVMSSAKFSHKRVGYVAASMSFNDDTDVLMLTTNMLKKVKFKMAVGLILIQLPHRAFLYVYI